MSCKIKTKALTKNFDLFGKPIGLNFDEKGDNYQTYFGSLCSLGLITVLIYLVSIKGDNMIKKSDPIINFYNWTPKLKDLGFIDMN